MACDTFITVARSRCSTGAPIVPAGPGARSSSAELRIELIELPHLPVGAPTQIAVAGVPQIHLGNRLEAARRVEARGQFVGERLIVNKAVGAGRANRLFVEVLGIELAALEAGDLGADQGGAVLEIVRAIRRPELELLVMRSDSVQMLLPLRRPVRRRSMRRGTARHRSDTPPFRTVTAMSTAAVAPSTRPRWPRHSRRQRSAPAACGSSTSTRQRPNPDFLKSGARSDARQTAHRRRSRMSASSRAASGSARAG